MAKVLLVSLVHNRAALTALALNSAVNQTFKNFIHLVIDNASTDHALQVANTYADKYSNIVVKHFDTNLHQMPSYNWALDWVSKNYPDIEIMAQLDSDDIITPNALEEVVKVFDAHKEVGQTYSDFNIINASGKTLYHSHPKAKLIPDQFTQKGQKTLRTLQISQNIVGHLRAMRISCLKDIGGFDETRKYATDFSMACKMMEKYSVVKIPKVLYHWRDHGDQVQGHHSPEQTKNWIDLQQYYDKRWKDMGII